MQFLFHNNSKSFAVRSVIVICLCSIYINHLQAQQLYKLDNKSYKAVYPNQAVQLMNEHPDYILIDVRTPGEYADTSQYTGLNMGHLKGAININIDSFPQHLADLKKYSNKNIFLYCSHSQRSRRVSRLLAENGFTNVYNINGGMSVINESSAKEFPLKSTVFVSSARFKNVASADALAIIDKPGALIIDVRNSDEFQSKGATFHYNLGYLKNAINIPAADFKDKFEAMHISKDKTILLYDGRNSASNGMAANLANNGYTHVYNLFEGLSAFMSDNFLTPAQINKAIVNPPAFKIISIKECINMLSKQNNYLIIDGRPADEFANKSSKAYLNVGHLVNAVNVTSVEALSHVLNNVNKGAVIILYGSTSSNIDSDVCKALVAQGYTNVYYLYEGVGQFAWACFNVENCKNGLSLLTDHDGLY